MLKRRQGLSVPRWEIKDAFGSSTGERVADDVIDDFIEYLRVDICEWLRDNVKCYLRVEEVNPQ